MEMMRWMLGGAEGRDGCGMNDDMIIIFSSWVYVMFVFWRFEDLVALDTTGNFIIYYL
jgi:hypothetical protein